MLEGRREDFGEGMLGGFGAVKQQRPPALVIEGRGGKEEEKGRNGGGMDMRVLVARTRRKEEVESRPGDVVVRHGGDELWGRVTARRPSLGT
jgi:hypothetical protein